MILCAGEALIDMLPRQMAAGEAAFAPYPGGAVFNTAIALGRLGVPTGFLCGLSRDLFGAVLDRALADAGVDTALCPRTDRPTPLAFVTLLDGQARYAFYVRETALGALAPADMPPLPAAVQVLFLGGISLAGEPGGTAFESLVHTLGDRVLMLDPNIRPGFIADEAAYRARLARLIARADIVKLSDEDLRWLFPGQPQADAIGGLRAAGAPLVLITRGADGAEGYGPGGAIRVPAVPVSVADTVGAGDTFNAGLLAGLARAGQLTRPALRDLDPLALETALHLAVRAAAVTASRPGADPPRAAELGLT